MKATTSRKAKQEETWPREVQPGRAIVRVYRRTLPSGEHSYLVANYADGGKRRLDCYASEADALDAADKLAKRLDACDYVAASMTKDQASEFANADARLKPYNVTVDAATAAVVEWLKQLGSLENVHAAVKFYRARFKQTVAKPVAKVVAELLEVKASRGASERYTADLRSRLERFARNCQRDACNVTASDVQAWLDGLKSEDKTKLSPQSYRNYRTTLHTLFQFAVARGYAVDNPVEGVEKLKVRNGDVEIFTPVEIARLLESAKADCPAFLPCLAIGAFAGLRSAELERLDWADIDLTARHIVVAASKSKTASRRIVPIADNLAEWLRPYSGRQGQVWTGGHFEFYDAQQEIADATVVEADEAKGIKAQKPVAWKSNALRHSYASYRFAQTSDAGKVAGELGNSATVVHRHYRELVKPEAAKAWFAVAPSQPENVLSLSAAATAATA